MFFSYTDFTSRFRYSARHRSSFQSRFGNEKLLIKK